jgi:hypothetical protein
VPRDGAVRKMEKRNRECVRGGVLDSRHAESDVTGSAAVQAAALDLKQSQLAPAEICGQTQESFSTRERASC